MDPNANEASQFTPQGISDPQPAVPPPVPPSETMPLTPNLSPGGHTRGKLAVLIIISLIVVVALSGGGYYVVQNGVFKGAPYKEESIFSDSLKRASEIRQATYSLKTSLSVVPRESGAVPFTIDNSNSPQLRAQYERDSKRANDISAILGALHYSYGDDGYIPGVAGFGAQGKPASKPYPETLEALRSDLTKRNSYQANFLGTDPVTKNAYEYRLTENGKNFELTAHFETTGATRSIKKSYSYVATTTLVNGQTVTFTKKSSTYLYVPSVPPKPFLVMLGEQMRSMPPDVNMNGEVKATADFATDGIPDWDFNMDFSGSLGDLTYKFNADAKKKAKDYFFRINNMPSIFFSALSSIKGQWIRVTSDSTSPKSEKDPYSYYYNEFEDLARELPKLEESYKKGRGQFVDMLVKLAKIADEEKLTSIKERVGKEKVNGETLYRYKLELNEAAIVSFYRRAAAELATGKNRAWYQDVVEDQGFLEYLESKEFKDLFAYYNQNTFFTLWVNKEGVPARAEYRFRIVPPDTAIALRDKQVNLVFTMSLSNVNEPVTIEVPSSARSIRELMDEFKKNQYEYSPEATLKSEDASLKASLSGIRASAEIVYDSNSGYEKKAFPLGPCSKKEGTLFADSNVYKSLEMATANNVSNAICISVLKAGKVESYAVSISLPSSPDYSWCIDSSGNSMQIAGSISKAQCK